MMGRLLPLATLLLAAPVLGAELSRTVTDVTPIVNERGAARLLFKTSAPVDLTNVAIREATLTFASVGALEDRRIALKVHPVTTAWTPGAVDWNTGWSRPGGDFDDARYTRVEVDLARDRRGVTFDLTAVLKEIVEEGIFADGFIVTVDPEEGEGIRALDLARLGALATAELTIKYRQVPPRPLRRIG